MARVGPPLESNLQQGLKPTPALSDAINTMRETVERGWGVPQRFSATMREIWMFQPQFENRKGARPHKLFAQARFRAAYDFLLLRAETGNADRALAEWWTAFQTASAEQRTEMTKNEAAARHEKNEGQAKKTPPSQAQTQAEGCGNGLGITVNRQGAMKFQHIG